MKKKKGGSTPEDLALRWGKRYACFVYPWVMPDVWDYMDDEVVAAMSDPEDEDEASHRLYSQKQARTILDSLPHKGQAWVTEGWFQHRVCLRRSHFT